MALQTARGLDAIPSGSVVVTRKEALDNQRALIRDWDKESQVQVSRSSDTGRFFLRYSRHIASLAVGLTSCIIIKHYARNLRARTFDLMYVVPCVTAPVIWMNYERYNEIVTDNILVMKMTCPMCIQLRSLFSQCVLGVLVPSALSALALSAAAEKRKVIPIPDIQYQFKTYFQFMFQIAKKGSIKYQMLGGIHIICALMLPYMQGIQLQNIMEILENKEKTYMTLNEEIYSSDSFT